ncbi:MAG: hypothetical protein JO144_15435 [Actinobacteria bacterium]|nr:hypothetical protein [Actinomycetota bacterium]
MSAVGYDLRFALEALWKVALASLILGAGLPVLFAAGIRSLAWGHGESAEQPGAGSNPLGKVLAGVIFLVVGYAILAGLVYIVATGKGSDYDITFAHLIPQIEKKGA